MDATGDATEGWLGKVSQKREVQRQALAGIEDCFDAAVTEIGSIPALVARIAEKKITSEAVTKAYIHKAAEAHKLTNCLTEVLFADAITRARELDAYQAEHGKLLGPLHGVPVTLKDQFNVKGYDTTLGYVGRAFKPATEDAVLVEMLKKLGAVIIAKTNLPQSIMWCETENPLWGLTTNPTSEKYTPGGSTGGESALLALKGSLLGFGTDIGGSVRIPSHMMGLYGLKPSSSRLPYYGVPVSTEGQEHVPSSVGPLARSLETLSCVMRELVDSKPWEMDARCAPKPWNEEVFCEFQSKPLTIGLLADDGIVRPHPPITRVLLDLVEKLRNAGHDIVEWDASLHAECIQVMDEYYMADGGEDVRRDMEAGGEPYIPHVEALVNRGKPISVYEYWQLNRRKIELQQAYLRKWDSVRSPKTGKTVDVILMPAMPHTAVPHRSCRWVGYTKIWNVLDYSSLIVPAGEASPVDMEMPWDNVPRNVNDEWNLGVWAKHKAEMTKLGLPVGVQIVGRRLEEEKVLGVGSAIDALVQ